MKNFKKKNVGEASFNEIYRQYKATAKLKNRKFKLTKKQFRYLTSLNCSYCNSKPNTIRKTHIKKYNGAYQYNGIDRVDNDQGYTIENSVTCCELCNRMKAKLTKDKFLSHIFKIFLRSIKRA